MPSLSPSSLRDARGRPSRRVHRERRAVYPWHDSDDIPIPEFDFVPTFPWDEWSDDATGFRRGS